MSLTVPPPASVGAIEYPDDDGLPMSDNTKQLRWIVVFYGNLCALFRTVADVFVAGNHLWYPVKGELEIRYAPDVMVVFGRPKEDRGSYKQWEEGGVPVTVAFEILSPKNTATEMADKLAFYDEYGVEEYYLYDPQNNHLHIYVRRGEVLVRVRKIDGYVSPRLGIRFDLSGPEMVVFNPNGRRFRTFEELEDERVEAERRAEVAQSEAKQARQEADKAEHEAKQARQEADKAQHEVKQARQETELAQHEVKQARQEADKAQHEVKQARQEIELAQIKAEESDKARREAEEAVRRMARVLELSRKAGQQQASSEELQELQRLEDETTR